MSLIHKWIYCSTCKEKEICIINTDLGLAKCDTCGELVGDIGDNK